MDDPLTPELEKKVVELNQQIDKGLAQAERGEVISGAESRQRLQAARNKLPWQRLMS